MSNDGQLMRLEKKPDSVSFNTSSWEGWCSKMDAFGILVMIAASLLE
jgi:hypothetical protein